MKYFWKNGYTTMIGPITINTVAIDHFSGK
jgi:hypothetical protein